ncbi:asparagine synthase-related protein [Halobacterium salinarum]|uniref:asparagine synthase-related protein n=1 Tax=Halobacterium salinarum TaxID=2242 RepID=UPI0025533F41|nr:asparagine synthase-related protein [Halobacterium salinarum]MDL0132057.1 asparagine synthase-related protein [Halobacterium salinarum]
MTRDGIIYDSDHASDAVAIFGDFYHSPETDLLDEYREKPIEEFLRVEASKSVGNYAIVDSSDAQTVIITSTAYEGGYIQSVDGLSIGDNLQSVLATIPDDQIRLKPRCLKYTVGADLTEFLPISTIFNGVTRLPPGCIVTIEDGRVADCQCYIEKGRTDEPTLGGALEQAVSALANSEKEITVMYSGGADSTALCLALKNQIGGSNFKAFSVDIGPGVHSQRIAQGVGDRFGIKTHSMEFGWPPTGDFVTTIENQLAQDFINPLNPFWPFHTQDGDRLVLSMQNMDAMLHTDMNRPQTSYVDDMRGVRSAWSIAEEWLRNTQFIDLYENNPLIQRAYTSIIPKLRESETEPTPGEEGYYMGLLSSYPPNFIPGSKQVLGNEVELLCEIFGGAIPGSDYANYLQYQHNAGKSIQSYKSDNAVVHLPAMWGPVASYCLGRGKSLFDAVSPKREIYQYIERVSGVEYRSVRSGTEGDRREIKEKEREVQQSMVSPLLIENRDHFDVDVSRVLDLLDDPPRGVVDHYEKVYENVREGLALDELREAHVLLNIEKILDERFG